MSVSNNALMHIYHEKYAELAQLADKWLYIGPHQRAACQSREGEVLLNLF